nr:hypothetical protein [Tanacetum cinerariifolium]
DDEAQVSHAILSDLPPLET